LKPFKGLFVVLVCTLLMMSCAASPPSQTEDVCKIFQEKPKWYWAAKDVAANWGVPVPVQMAILHQESRFRAKARPPRRWILGVIPWFRPSSAYGYAQILDVTWDDYVKSTGRNGSRDDFATVTDFIGWYADRAKRQAKVPKNDAYKLYLAYHEGAGGYLKHTYQKKPWLISVAKKVNKRSGVFKQQLAGCASSIPSAHWWNFL
jgi:hypothetical protein